MTTTSLQFHDGTEWIIHSDGSQHWYHNGFLHREGDKPAVIDADGTQEWFRDNKRHREDDKPAIIWPDGSQEWYLDGFKQR